MADAIGGRLVWDQTGERLYETGVEQGAVYPQANDGTYPAGEAWNGLTGVTQSPSGAEPTALYANNKKYLTLMSTEEFACTIESYTYPDSFAECDGSASIGQGVTIGQQKRRSFGLAYKTLLGNDVQGDAYAYKLHLIYGLQASPSERAYATVNDSPEAATMSWECNSTPVDVSANHKPTACLEVDSTKADPTKLKALEDILYGTNPTLLAEQPGDWTANYANYLEFKDGEYTAVAGDAGSAPAWAADKYYTPGTAARLPLPAEVAELMPEAA